MHVMVTEARFGDSDRLVQLLRTIGVRVTPCHDRVGYCRVLRPGGHCPLDRAADQVDLVVDVRDAGTELTAREYGAVCGVRARRPVWIVSPDLDTPTAAPAALRDNVTVVSEQELLTMCQRRNRATAGSLLGPQARC